LRVRLTFLFVIIFGSTSILFSLAVYYSLNDSLLQDFDLTLYNYSIDVAQLIEIGPQNDLLIPSLRFEHEKIFPFSSGNSFFLVRHISGQLLTQNGTFDTTKIPFDSEVKKIASGFDSAYLTLQNLDAFQVTEADNYRLITFPLDNTSTPTLFLQIAVPMTTFEKQLDRLKLISVMGLPAVLFLSVLLGLYFSMRALAPVKEMIDKTRNIDAGNLKERVPLPASRDEIQELAQTLNQMLDRIEKSFASQEKFVADASHQLLTPLTILVGEIEAQLKHHPEQTVFLTSLLQESQSLSKIVKDMLLLARIDGNYEGLIIKEIDVEDLIIEVILRTKKMADQKNIKVKFILQGEEHHTTLRADPDLLINVFYNLLENAIKYSSTNQSVTLTMTWTSTTIVLEIADFGPGIADVDKQIIFERFSRVGLGNVRSGYGLGLSIALKIANLHQFKLSVRDQVGSDESKKTGSIFVLEMKNF
jgi:signal transduction histidine kinase